MAGAYAGWKIGSKTGFNNMDEPKETPKGYQGYSTDDPEWRDEDNDGFDDRDDSEWDSEDDYDDEDDYDNEDDYDDEDDYDSDGFEDDYDRDERDW